MRPMRLTASPSAAALSLQNFFALGDLVLVKSFVFHEGVEVADPITHQEFDTIARLETQAIDEHNDNHHYRGENPLDYLCSSEPQVKEA